VNEDELRALVRAAIQRNLGTAAEGGVATKLATIHASEVGPIRAEVGLSFGQYRLERAPDDTMCLIEPAVRCNHCGYCKCHGH
jgi:hypothetical protein